MKKMLKSVLALAMVAVMALSFAACGAKDDVNKDSADNGEETTKLIMATNAEFPPFEFVATDGKGVCGEFDGIDIAIANEIAKDMDATLEVSNMDFNSIIPAVDAGKADIGIAGMTVTEDRLKNVDFSDPYWVAVQTIIVKGDNTDITNVETLKGKKVGVVTGYTGDLTLTDIGGIELARYQKGIDAVQDVINGKIDAAVIDSPTAASFIAKNPDLKGIEDDTVFEKEEYAIAIKKGNSELLEKVNATIKRLNEENAIAKIAEEVDGRMAQ